MLFYIVEKDEKKTDFMILQVKMKKINDWILVKTFEEGLELFNKSNNESCIIINNDMYFHYNFRVLLKTLNKESLKLSDSIENDAVYFHKENMELKDIPFPLFGILKCWDFLNYDFLNYPFNEKIECLFKGIIDDYTNYFDKLYDVTYQEKEIFEKHVFRFHKPFIIFIEETDESKVRSFCEEINKSLYTYFRIFVSMKMDNTILINENSIVSSNKNEILVRMKNLNSIPDLFKLNKRLYNEKEIDNENYHVTLCSNLLYTKEKTTMEILELCLNRKDIDYGINLINYELSKNTSFQSVFQYCLSKISFLTIKESYKELEIEIVRYLVFFKNEYEIISNLGVICNSYSKNINGDVQKKIYLKLLEFKEESDEQKLILILKLLSLKIDLEEMGKIVNTYSKLVDKDEKINNIVLNTLFKKISFEFSGEMESNLLNNLMKTVSNDFKFFNTLASESEYNKAQSYFEKYYPELILRLCDFIDPYLSTTNEILKRREEIEKSFEILLKYWTKTYSLNDIIFIGISNFALSYHGLSSKKIFMLKSKFVRKVCPDLNYEITHEKNKEKKIGFISAFLNREHSVYKDRHQIIKKLANTFEVYFFTLDPLHESVKYNYGNAKHILLKGNLSEMRDQIANMCLDILVYCEIGMHPVMYYLAHMRLAHIQLNTWGHSDTSGISTIDYYMTSKYYDNVSTAKSNYSEKVILLDSLCTCYVDPLKNHKSFKFRQRNELGYSNNVNIYLCPQSLFKFSPTFEEYLFGILEKDPNGIIVLLDGMGKGNSLLERFENKNYNHLTRIRFIPGMSHFDYLNMIYICDVMIDTYPFGGCNSSLEAFSLGKAVVTQTANIINGRFTTGFLKKMGLKELIVKNKADYIKLAVKIATNKKYQKELKGAILSKCSVLFEEEKSFLDWKDFIDGLY